MDPQHDRNADELQRRAGALRQDIAPGRDLWPGIAARLGPAASPVSQPRSWTAPWLPMGAALAAGYLLATWLPLPWLGSGPQPPTPEQRLEIVASVQPALDQLPAKTRAVVEANLSGLEQDWLSIEQALAVDPDNPLLRELRMNAQDRAASVREQMIRLTSAASEGLEI